MTTRTRRSCLAVPGSSQKFIDKARTLPVDQVFLDLEDACAPLAKPGARKTIVEALNEGGWGDRLRVVRVNDWTTEWTYRDVTEVVEGAGAQPRRDHAAQGADPRADRRPRPADDAGREGDGLRARQDRHRGADRERVGAHQRQRDRHGLPARRDDHLRPRRLHGVDQHEVAGGGGAAARLRRGRRLPPHPHVDPHGRAGARQAGHRRALPADQGRRRLPTGGRALGGAGLRRQVGAAPRPDRGRERGVQPGAGRLRPRREHPRRLRVVHVGGGRPEGRGHARRRDDRRGEPQDGVGDRGQGPRGGHAAHRPLDAPRAGG